MSAPERPDLIAKAGLVLARLMLAYAPHGTLVWIACGPGKNGADGLSAALQLRQFGKNVVLVTPEPTPLFEVAIDVMFDSVPIVPSQSK